jgi:hypothetical protein
VTRSTPSVLLGPLVCLVLSACPPRAATGGEANNYDSAVARWTAQAELYQLEDIRAKFAATLLSEPFRRALVAEQARRLEFGPEQTAEMMGAQRAEGEAHTVFILGMYVNPARDNDLGPKSNFRITLMTPSEELHPESIKDFGTPTENERALYPYLDVFWREYKLFFKPVKTPGPWTLRIASDLGTVQLVFLQPTGGKGGEPHAIPVSRAAPEGTTL